ncbi:MAG: hypothetical protein JSS86_20950 [Cyanobacteria bacterium SZAS LIN-2]|nr:hypothetical protein [Cyanobacteria bacterium SZAS LIN-2]MBS2010163.1 hypothetical protein [Cyanobacteria bacterium SZAS TMP-1]
MYNQSAAEDYSSPRTMRATTRVNNRGDRYRKNDAGAITSFKFGHSDFVLTIDYDQDGKVFDIESTAGWSWSRMSTPAFDGWLVRNCLDRWYVTSEECNDILVTEFGIKAVGNNPEKMDLPERP